MDSIMELYEELIHTQTKSKNKKKQPDLELQEDQSEVETKSISKRTKIKKVKSKESINDQYLEMSQPPTFSQIQCLSKTSYRVRDVFELSDDDDNDGDYKFSIVKNNETIILESDSEDTKENKNDFDDLNFILNSFQEIKIGAKIITNEKNDESIIEDMSTYLPLSQRIKKKFGISSETIFKK
jgi:hypothetical protein